MEVHLRNLSKSYGPTSGQQVLSSVEARLHSGMILALLGDNGAGKTTLLRLLAARLCPTEGEIMMDGEVLLRQRLDLRRRLLFLPDFPQFPGGSVLDGIALHLKHWGVSDSPRGPEAEARAVQFLQKFGLETKVDRAMRNLSRGQAYKAAFTTLAAVDPDLWLLDEPFASGMDPTGLSIFRTEAGLAAQERGRIVVYSTQMLYLACEMSTHIGIVQRGALRLLDTERDVGRDPQRVEKLMELDPCI
jgi:ABC-type multidrug transport system ATPase subunit